MNDASILAHIHDLTAEEKRLRAAGHAISRAERDRLHLIGEELDQAWDLLRQRRAWVESGGDPEQAHERSVDSVESYLQ